MKENPCKKDCPRRSPTCHATCKEYKEFRQKLDERNDLIRRERELYDSFRTVEVESCRRIKRITGHRHK